MAFALEWDKTGEKTYETGTRMGVLYPKTDAGQYGTGVAWNGLTAITESPSGAEETKLFADDQKYLSLYSAEEFGATVEAYTYPDEWAECDGSALIADGVYAGQQVRKGFGMCYRTVLGNDEQGEGYAYKLHLLYGGMASPSEKSYATINDSPDAVTFSWEITTTPINLPGDLKPTSILTIYSNKIQDKTKLTRLENILYGTAAVVADPEHNIEAADAVAPRLPLPEEVISIIGNSNASNTGTGN